MMHAEFLAFSSHLADLARGEIIPRFRTMLTIDDKADASPVTLADRNAEAVMRAAIEKAYPTHGVIGEEYGAIREDAEWVWVLDPVDGTKSFICGRPTFTTLIGLMHRGQPTLGVIDQAILNERWIGISNAATTLNGQPVRTSNIQSLAQARIGSTGPQYYTADGLSRLTQLQAASRFTLWGGDAYLFGQVALGGLDIGIEQGLKLHDFAALAPVVLGAGGMMTDWQGKALDIESDGAVLASANPTLHAAALSCLAG